MLQRIFCYIGLICLFVYGSVTWAAEQGIHYFDCKECHLAGLSLLELGNGNVCLSCHNPTAGDIALNSGAPATLDGHTDNRLASLDASNAFNHGSGSAAAYQTSHTWAAPKDTLAAAGAESPDPALHPEFYSRYGASVGRLTCSRCHNPHAPAATNPKLLVKGVDSADAMCRACHAPWDQANNHGWLTHPMVTSYNTVVTAKPDKFKTVPANKESAGIRLFDGGVSCTSCHGIHFVDSDASTSDGPLAALNKSDGKLLRGDGAGRDDKSSLCQTCHTYREHGDGSGEKVGCLGCHSGHSYDPELPNYYVLRKSATTTAYNTVTGLNYSSPSVLVGNLKYTFWNDGADGSAEGYCERCHGDAVTIGAGAGSYHNKDATCTDCHKHDNIEGGFMAACSSCHGDGNSKSWPSTATGGSYPDRQGAHEQHVTAIGNARGQSANVACDTCHPGTPPAGHPDDNLAPARLTNMDLDGDGNVDTDPGSFKRANGLDEDPLARYDAVTTTCDNTGCHGGQTTLPWYWVPDAEPPVWPAGSGIIAADPANGGVLNVSWSAATDTYPSDPVRYDLHMATVGTAEAVFSGPPVRSALLCNSATLAGLADGQAYYFGVRAKDSAYTPNLTTNLDISAGVAPSSPGGVPAGTSQTYYGSLKDNYFISVGVDGTVNDNWGLSSSPDDFARIWMQTDGTKYSSSSGFRKVHWADSSFFNTLARIYLKPARSTMESFASTAWVGPDLSGKWGGRYIDYATPNGANTHKWIARLLDYDPATGDTVIIGESAAGEIPTVPSTFIDHPFVMTFPRYLLPHGHLLTLEILVKPTDTADGVEIWVDRNNDVGRSAQITLPVFELPADNTPPVWEGGSSGITVQNTGEGGTLSVNWNDATDTDNAPVLYDLYRSSISAADVWNNLYRAEIIASPFVDSGLVDGTTHYYGVRAKDSSPTGANVTTNTDTASAVPDTGAAIGFDCTSCHGIPPQQAANAGVHASHADSDSSFDDCDHCHPQTSAYGTGHQNGVVELNFSGAAHGGIRSGAGNTILTYYDDGFATGAIIYRDSDGAGGLNFNTGGSNSDDGIDDGTCSNTACHGTASPAWQTGTTIQCGTACHGTASARSGYSEPAGGLLQGAPPTDRADNTSSYEVGKHLEHINISYNLVGDSCALCHEGAGSGASVHGDGTVQVNFPTEAGPAATWTDSGINQAPGGTCGGLDPNACHGDKSWSPDATIACTDCHGFGGANPSHVSDAGQARACTWCHPSGHPAGPTPGTVFIPNNASVGIDYSSGGIHLLADIGGRGIQASEAQLCWSCHAAQTPQVSEWGRNQNANTGGMIYNSGTLDQANWVGATWTSATTQFAYKSGLIQSTHTANDSGTSALTGSDYNYTETIDSVGNIRCSYCHDVHGRHLVWGGDLPAQNGEPYLRGTWLGNPYKEDGAPQSGTIYEDFVSADGFNEWGRVPRASNNPAQLMGGYWIDQNSGNPTTGWTLESSAGLCILCHGSDVDNMDSETGEALWVGTNGHSNAVIGGTTLHAANIFDARGGAPGLSPNPYQHFQGMNTYAGYRGPGDLQYTDPVYAFRAKFSDANDLYNARTWKYAPYINEDQQLPEMADHDDWGVNEVGDATQLNYHQFSCSKCHNPHASRLPKLMITNCLDTKHNSWDNDYQVNQASPGSNNYNRSLSNWTSAQNCHRLGGDDPSDTRDAAGVGGGWNLATPWD